MASNSTAARTCLCSPTSHPGSFRCRLHRNYRGRPSPWAPAGTPAAESRGTASKAKILRVVLMQIIGPSRNNLDRRRNFQPKPTRFCLLNGGGGGRGVAVA